MGRSCHVKNCKNSQRNAHVFSVNQEKAKHFTEEFGYEFEKEGTRVWIFKNFEEDSISRYEYIFKDVNQNNIDKLINSPPPLRIRSTTHSVTMQRGGITKGGGYIINKKYFFVIFPVIIGRSKKMENIFVYLSHLLKL